MPRLPDWTHRLAPGVEKITYFSSFGFHHQFGHNEQHRHIKGQEPPGTCFETHRVHPGGKSDCVRAWEADGSGLPSALSNEVHGEYRWTPRPLTAARKTAQGAVLRLSMKLHTQVGFYHVFECLERQ